MTFNLTLRRLILTDKDRTIGALIKDNVVLCLTAERPWLDNAQGVSCIPAGTYEFAPHNTPDKPNCWELIEVHGRSSILIHAGNDPMVDSEGCILVGMIPYAQGVEQSQVALQMLRQILPPTGTIQILNP